MAFLSSVSLPTTPPVLRSDKVVLRIPALSDYGQWAALREASRNFLTPWEPTWPADDLTRIAFRRRIRRYYRDIRNGVGYPFFVFTADGLTLMGGLTLSHIRRGITQACALGYWMGAPYAGQGYMTAAVQTVIPFVFGTLNLNRIEAACLPHNVASITLLEKTGFVREGYAQRYLCINGRWQDHLLYGQVRDDRNG